ncbi:MAG: ABC transporter permease [Bifidobacterium sp.]|uniref:ABC transporter permease n=1 Tax=Bifidobacterium sp. TaxID=41200 RepID=UPI0039E7402E
MSATSAAAAQEDRRVKHLLLRRFMRNRVAVVGACIIIVFVLFVIIGPLVYRTNQTVTDLASANLPPSLDHILGTDAVGHDELGRLMYGGAISLTVGLSAGILATILGVLWGAIAGYVGGIVESAMMRLVDAGIAIPALFLLLVISAIVTPNVVGLILIIGFTSWLVPSRLLHAETLHLKEADSIATLRAFGGSHGRAIGHHILPNAMSTIVVAATFQVADAILLIAYVSYLGLGVQPPQIDWGGMLSSGLTSMYSGRWWLILPPGLSIILVVFACNAVGDGLRDAFEVRGR